VQLLMGGELILALLVRGRRPVLVGAQLRLLFSNNTWTYEHL
jgi:hypothetical protein